MQRTLDSSLACPSCGAQARIFKNGQSTCAYCGATLPPLPFTHPGGTFKHSSPLRIGMKAKLGGREYVAVGRLLFRDAEGYTWEEWVLLSQDGDAQYLEFDEGKWTIARYWPEGDQSVQVTDYSEGNTIALGGQTTTVTSIGTQTVSGVEGEIPWPVRVGERNPYADFGTGDTIFSVEQASDGIEWFRGRRLDAAEVYTLFGLQKEAKAEIQHDVVQADRRRFGCLWLNLSLLAFFLCAVASSITGRQVYSGQLTADQVAEEGSLVGPFPLKPENSPHRLYLSSGGLNQTSVWVQGVLEDASGPVFEAEQEFWDETGYDDGAWHEWVTDSNTDFRLNKAGDFKVRLYADPEAAATGAPITVRVYEGVRHATPLAWFGGIGLVLGTCFWLSGAPGARRGLAEAMQDK
ncbi:DUF4178 domain-containing protein [Armatimonas sp.]|uniref:DUF4178 domain-containing protein n=1 Tax=Armatimonas sp. TaxID=1872638 RepID=UPI00286A4B77|nr:DUF4178 domain-containing protein [Armatimonas sp.]